ncbi:MAG: DUF2911 domain-containing protein, partial [Bacteroidia bacterium]
IRFNGLYFVNGNKLEAGSYKVYCYPGKESFEFCFAPADGAWGAFEPDRSAELFKVEIPVKKLDMPAEQFAIRLLPQPADNGLQMICEFSDYQLIVPFKKS